MSEFEYHGDTLSCDTAKIGCTRIYTYNCTMQGLIINKDNYLCFYLVKYTFTISKSARRLKYLGTNND